ncbi:ANTAR domain-containing protein [Spirillospora sp. CA-294931]|uniref:ANTAR domain-containing protein n=1 Tax=Spirillospora sp. CA-294931 TaxID=3240042 RepID=UPI003D930950
MICGLVAGEVAMDRARVIRVRAAIAALAEGRAPSVADVCLACVRMTGADGASVSLMGTVAAYEPIYGTGARAEALTDLQVMVGEGPGVEAIGQDRSVLVPALDATGIQRRWPLFAPQATELGVAAVFAFPLMLGAIAVGVLEVHWREWLPAGEPVADGLLFAQAALVPATLLRLRLPNDGTPVRDADELVERWPEVHQATGIISVQINSGLPEALARLRAYAYSHEITLREAAHRVVDRTLRFTPDGEEHRGLGTGDR